MASATARKPAMRNLVCGCIIILFRNLKYNLMRIRVHAVDDGLDSFLDKITEHFTFIIYYYAACIVIVGAYLVRRITLIDIQFSAPSYGIQLGGVLEMS